MDFPIFPASKKKINASVIILEISIKITPAEPIAARYKAMIALFLCCTILFRKEEITFVNETT
jgi:hypothetical protein